MNTKNYIIPNWPPPKNIKAFSTTRIGGFSKAPYESFNLGAHVNDNLNDVLANREKLLQDLELPNEPHWLNQVHGNKVISIDSDVMTKSEATKQSQDEIFTADGSYTHTPNTICAVMTADCLPILICNKQGTEVMALHGGWRSLAAGIISEGIKLLYSKPDELLVWLGPSIGPKAFEVGEEVKEQFCELSLRGAQRRGDLIQHFKPKKNNKYLMDIYGIATVQFKAHGIEEIYSTPLCTYSNPEKFFSYRREGVTGRMATLIYF